MPVTSSSVSDGEGDRDEASGSMSRIAKPCGGLISVRHRASLARY